MNESFPTTEFANICRAKGQSGSTSKFPLMGPNDGNGVIDLTNTYFKLGSLMVSGSALAELIGLSTAPTREDEVNDLAKRLSACSTHEEFFAVLNNFHVGSDVGRIIGRKLLNDELRLNDLRAAWHLPPLEEEKNLLLTLTVKG